MERKELVMGIVDLYDELQKTKHELEILRLEKGLSKISGETVEIHRELTASDRLAHLVKQELLTYRTYSLPKVVNDAGEIVKFEEWYKNLTADQITGYKEDVYLEVVSLRDLKSFFKPELKDWYEAEKSVIVTAKEEK